MNRRYALTPAAQRDLEQIWDYTSARWSDVQAEGYVWDIQRAVELLAENPLLGRACDEVRTGYRRHTIGSHVLYYRVAATDLIEIVRVLHKQMDVNQHLD